MPGQFVQFTHCWLRGCVQEGDVVLTQCVQGWVFSDVAGRKTSCSGGAVVWVRFVLGVVSKLHWILVTVREANVCRA